MRIAPLAALAAAALALGAATVGLAVDGSPRTLDSPAPDLRAAARLREWLRTHDPRRARDGRLYVLHASADELALLAGQAARLAGGSARTQLGDGTLSLALSVPFHGVWINVQAELADGPELPAVQRLQVGDLVLPAPWAQRAVELSLAFWDRPRDGQPPWREMAQGVRWQPQRATVVYRWRADLPQALAGTLLPPAQVARLRAYHDAVHARVRAHRGVLDLPDLLAPVFALARERSAGGGDAAAENRAALLVLASYAARRPLGGVLPAARGWPPLRPRPLVMAGRIDFPIHYLVSAALAAEAGGPLADTLGLLKEAADARGGSGFSFNDVAVNRAGTRLGELALRDPARVQAALAGGGAVLLPEVSDLPEFLAEPEFRRRYGGIGEPAYEALRADIEARIASLPLYR